MKSSIFIEEWLDIPGYEGLYQVSNLGRVKSLDHIGKSKHNGLRLFKGKLIKQDNKLGTEYKRTTLCKNGKQKHFSVHRLVALAFLPNPDNLPQVNHINECPWDNAVWNLEWCDGLYNVRYGTGINRRCEKQKLTMSTIKPVLQYTKNGQFVFEYSSINEAARQTGLRPSNISNCCKGKYGCKTAGGYVWKYKD